MRITIKNKQDILDKIKEAEELIEKLRKCLTWDVREIQVEISDDEK